MKKITPIITALTILISGCNIYSNDTVSTKEKLPIVKTDFKLASETPPTPETLHFESKAITQNFNEVFKLPDGKHFKLELTTQKNKEKIRIPISGNFNIIFKKSISTCKKDCKIQIIDNDATDGSATVLMPDPIMEGYLKLQDESNSSDKLTIEDKLYFVKHDLNTLSPSNKDKWYKLGSKPFPIPNDWHSSDGNDYILNFNNSGIKNAEFRWFSSNKPDYPMNITMVTPESGGTIDFKGVGKIDVPAGAVDKHTIISMTQELNVPEIIELNTTNFVYRRSKDFISPVVKIEPFGLTLKKPASLYLDYDKNRLGNNHPSLITYNKSNNKLNWIKFDDILSDYDFFNMKPEITNTINSFSYFTRLISHFVKPTSNIQPYNPYNDNNNSNFKTNSLPINTLSTFVISSYSQNINYLYRRAEFTYNLFSSWTNLYPKGDNRGKITINYSNEESNEELNIGNTDIFLPSKTLEDKNTGFATTYINTAPDDYSLEREIWHHFQLALFPKDSNQKTKFYDSYIQNNPHNWWIKSSAEYMGALAYKLGSIQNLNDGSRLSYFERDFKHRKYLLDKQLSFPITYSSVLDLNENLNFPNDVEKYLGDYYNWAFFSFLSHPKTKASELNSIINFHTQVENTNRINKFLLQQTNDLNNPKTTIDRFHDFAVHDLLFDRYDIFENYVSNTLNTFPENNVEKISINKDNLIDKNNFIPITSQIDNFKIKYYKIYSTDLNNPTIAIKILNNQNNCLNNVRVSAIQYKNGKPVYKTKENQYKYSLLEKNTWNNLPGLNTSFDTLTLVVSNNNGMVDNTNASCEYTLNIGYICPQNKSCTSNPCPYTTTSYNTKGSI